MGHSHRSQAAPEEPIEGKIRIRIKRQLRMALLRWQKHAKSNLPADFNHEFARGA